MEQDETLITCVLGNSHLQREEEDSYGITGKPVSRWVMIRTLAQQLPDPHRSAYIGALAYICGASN